MRPQDLGVGVVWWPPLDALCRDGEGLVDVIEAEPEAFWAPGSDGESFRSYLGMALRHLSQPKLMHGVGAPVGGTCSPPAGHNTAFARDIADLQPEFISEHLSVNQFRPEPDQLPVFAGFMLPPLQSEAGIALAAANIRRRRTALGGIPLAIETAVSYLRPSPGEMPDGEYVGAVAESADCGILLDLHNIWCNARNGRQSVAAFCDTLPLDRVWELHLAGGEDESGFRVDAHSGLVAPELMDIAGALLPRLRHLRAIIFEIIPERAVHIGLSAIGAQLGSIKDLWNSRSKGSAQPTTANRPEPSQTSPCDPESWERLLGCAITGLRLPNQDASKAEWWRSNAPAIDLYRILADEGRASAAATAARLTTRLLLQRRGGPGTRLILADFWRQSRPGYTAADEAKAFFRFLSEGYAALPGLTDAIASDAAALARLQGP